MGNKPNGLPDYREHPVLRVPPPPPPPVAGLRAHIGRSIPNDCYFVRIWPFGSEEEAARYAIERVGVEMAHETDYKPRQLHSGGVVPAGSPAPDLFGTATTVADFFQPLDETATTTVKIEHFGEPGYPDDEQLVLHALRADGKVQEKRLPRSHARHLDETTEDYHARLERENPLLEIGGEHPDHMGLYDRQQRAADDGPDAVTAADADGFQALALARIPIVIIESPYAGDIERNTAYARAALFDCLERGEAPYASHLLYTQVGVLDDSNHAQRERGMAAGWAFLRCADRVVVYSDLGVSDGMRRGIQRAEHHGLEIEYRSLPQATLADIEKELRERPARKITVDLAATGGPELAQAIRANMKRLDDLPVASFPKLPSYEEATPWAIRFMRKLLLIDGLAKKSFEAARDQQIDIAARLDNARLRRASPPPAKKGG